MGDPSALHALVGLVPHPLRAARHPRADRRRAVPAAARTSRGALRGRLRLRGQGNLNAPAVRALRTDRRVTNVTAHHPLQVVKTHHVYLSLLK